jgi:hypothetical protein
MLLLHTNLFARYNNMNKSKKLTTGPEKCVTHMPEFPSKKGMQFFKRKQEGFVEQRKEELKDYYSRLFN